MTLRLIDVAARIELADGLHVYTAFARHDVPDLPQFADRAEWLCEEEA